MCVCYKYNMIIMCELPVLCAGASDPAHLRTGGSWHSLCSRAHPGRLATVLILQVGFSQVRLADTPRRVPWFPQQSPHDAVTPTNSLRAPSCVAISIIIIYYIHTQGGAMAAQVADRLGARWSMLFSPIYAPLHPASCSGPTLVAFDRADPVMPATRKLLEQLSASADGGTGPGSGPAASAAGSGSPPAQRGGGGGGGGGNVVLAEHHEVCMIEAACSPSVSACQRPGPPPRPNHSLTSHRRCWCWQGHRLPAEAGWYAAATRFLEAQGLA
jgi:hypothetical protein